MRLNGLAVLSNAARTPFVSSMVLCTCLLISVVACGPKQGGAESAQGATAVTSKEVTYSSGSTQLKGFIAYPAGSKKRPAVLVAHEWWGLTAYVRARALKLAEAGYVAMAVDLYGEGKHTEHAAEAKEFMMAAISNVEESKKRFEAAQTLLASDPRVDGSKLAAIGYCFGGANVLHMARFGDNQLKLVGSFHGNLATQHPLEKDVFKGKIFVAQGGDDSFVPAEQVATFKQEMDAAGADYELVEYPGAKHGFTNPKATELGLQNQLPIAYSAEADNASWARFMELLGAL